MRAVDALEPEVAVLDLQLPDGDGVSVARMLHDELPSCHTVIVTSQGLPGHLKRALAVGGTRLPAQARWPALDPCPTYSPMYRP